MPNRPKPTERKRATGNPGHRRLPEPRAILRAPDGPPAAPGDLDRAGRAMWDLVWVEGSSWVGRTDAPLVALLCMVADELAAWKEQVADEGQTYSTKSGMRRAHPGIGPIHDLYREMAALLSLLGLSPTDRARLGLAEVRKVSHLADLLERRRRDIGR